VQFVSHTSVRFLVIMNGFVFIGYWFMMAIFYQHLPDQIPMHFNLSGEATRMAETTPGNWFLLPVIATITGLHAGLIVWAFLTAGLEYFNFPYKKKILQLNDKEKEPFKKTVKQFLKISLLSGFLYMLIILIAIGINSYLYALYHVSASVTLIILTLTVVYLGLLTSVYFRMKESFRKQLNQLNRQSV
jgi:uncharacterized membrane protein